MGYHDAKYRGNWSPYIPRNILLRYSKENLVLDQFVGGGTTLVEEIIKKKYNWSRHNESAFWKMGEKIVLQ